NVGTKNIARLANRLGIRSPISTNYAVTLGGLKEGVTALDMAHAYETFATGGVRIDSSNGLGGTDGGPVGIESIRDPRGRLLVKNEAGKTRIMSKGVASAVSSVLQGVVSSGTGKQAATGGFAAGKTGTTENYGDAWFVGWNEKYTVAVWVGYPDKVKSMKTEFGGSPVAGGTFPASIWREFILACMNIDQTRAADAAARKAGRTTATSATDAGSSGTGGSTSGSSGGGYSGGSTGSTGGGSSGSSGSSGGGGGGGNSAPSTGGGGNSTGGGNSGSSGGSGDGGASGGAGAGGTGPSG
ncbi:MAG: penicillin-binding transpeptidase domain-containing protein, partial [Solirubrobacterales bacterium]|nr:penicillin-binding transpeptidase domain-containing protein [Solirubrobacterales bacterium]